MTLRWDDRFECEPAAAQQAHLSSIMHPYGIRAVMEAGAALSVRVAARRAQLNASLLEQHEHALTRCAAAQTLGNHLKNAP
jgi:hypothetical protein